MASGRSFAVAFRFRCSSVGVPSGVLTRRRELASRPRLLPPFGTEAVHQDDEGRHEDRPDEERVQQDAQAQGEAELAERGQASR